MTRTLTSALLAGLLGLSAAAYADTTVTLNMAEADGAGKSIGTVDLADSPYGLVLTPKLTGLPPGQHGFHIHQNGSCDAKDDNGKKVPAGAAGGHFDPKGTKKHGTPWDDGAHAGDLPALFVETDGSAVYPVLAPRLKEADVKGLALMVHVGGDNHSDHPEALGGGGGRMACGVIPK